MPVERSIREGWSRNRLDNELARRSVEAAISHAKWAGHCLARVQMFKYGQVRDIALTSLGNEAEMLGLLRLYQVHGVLQKYALGVARMELAS